MGGVNTFGNTVYIYLKSMQTLMAWSLAFLQISDGKPLYVFTNVTTGQRWELGVDRSVSDGRWHVLLFRRHRQRIVVLLDERPVVDITHSLISHITFIVEMIVLGSAPPADSGDLRSGQYCPHRLGNIKGRK